MARLLQIAQLGNQILRQISEEIKQANDHSVMELWDDMLVTMLDTKGVGIAAPQVYVSQRCFVFSSAPGPGRPDTPIIEPTFVINPEILWKSDEIVRSWEGCLSIPGIRGIVPRYESINVQFIDSRNVGREETLSGFAARVFQHEYDHLDGIVYLDRLESTKDIFTEKECMKFLN
jgi:peptide deformylase